MATHRDELERELALAKARERFVAAKEHRDRKPDEYAAAKAEFSALRTESRQNREGGVGVAQPATHAAGVTTKKG